MVRKIATTLLVFVFMIVSAGTVFAGLNDRIREQQVRINQGVGAGRLTPREADMLQRNLNQIRATYERMSQTGGLTRREHRRLDNMLNRNDRIIFNKKHNKVRIY